MSDRRLEVFYAVAHLLSFTKAAEKLNMTQPAVTFQIRQFEDSFDTRLFDRGYNKISLTDAGKVVYRHTENILDLYRKMHDDIKSMVGCDDGNIILGASATIAEYMLPYLLGKFSKRYPDISINLKVANSEKITQMLDNNDIDLGIVEGFVSNKLLVVEECHLDQLVVIIPKGHDLMGFKKLNIENISKYPFIFRESGSGTREAITNYLNELGYDESILIHNMELGSLEAIKAAVEAGLGISIVSSSTINKELRLGILAAIKLEKPLTRPFQFVRQRHKFKLRAINNLLNFAREYCEDYKKNMDDIISFDE
ncbi:MAG: LysR family transcriptional regulator [Gammaproteobacteria bacterium]|nr:MAG: LysR family transcriptional regulator [Gammaproteobacteria bacterium]